MDDLSTENVSNLLGMLVKKLTEAEGKFFSDCNPEAIYSKKMIKRRYEVSQDRLDRLTQELSKHPERIENGANPMAPLRVWCSLLQKIPRNPRPRKTRR